MRALVVSLLLAVLASCGMSPAFAQTTTGVKAYSGSLTGTETVLGNQSGNTVLIPVSAIVTAAGAGSGALPLTGGTLTGPLTFPASTTGAPAFTCPQGLAPTSPSNGQAWCTSAGLFIHLGGVTYQVASAAGTLQAAHNLSDLTSPTTALTNLGLVPLGTSGSKIGLLNTANTFGAEQSFPAATTGGAGINLGQGSAPTTAVNGDLSITAAGLVATYAGAEQPIAPVSALPPIAPVASTSIKHDGVIFSDGAIASGANALTGSAETFSAADVGKGVVIEGAGPPVAAKGFIDFVSNPANGNTIVIHGSTITFVPGTPSGAQAQIGASTPITAANLVSYITTNTSSLTVSAAITAAAGVSGSAHITLTANSTGTGGNSIALGSNCGGVTQTPGCANLTLSGVLLTGGAAASPLYGTIASITSAHVVAVTTGNGCSGHACATVSGAAGYYATDDAAAIRAAIAVAGPAATFKLGAYNYGVGSGINASAINFEGQGFLSKLLVLAPMDQVVSFEPAPTGRGARYFTWSGLFVECGGLGNIGFYAGSYDVNDDFEQNAASDCPTAHEFDGTQNSQINNLETDNILVPNATQYAMKVLNAASGNVFRVPEMATASVRPWLWSVDTSQDGYHRFSNTTGPTTNRVFDGISEDGPAPITEEFDDSTLIYLNKQVLCGSGAATGAGPNVFVDSTSSLIHQDTPDYCGPTASGQGAVLDLGFRDEINSPFFNGGYGSSQVVISTYNHVDIHGPNNMRDQGYTTSVVGGGDPIFAQITDAEPRSGAPNCTGADLLGKFYQTDADGLYMCLRQTQHSIQLNGSFVFPLTDASTISIDAEFSNVMAVTLGGNHKFGNPTNLIPNTHIILQITQDGTGSRIPTWDTLYLWSAASPAFSTAAGAEDDVDCLYDGNRLKCSIVGKGYSTTPPT